MVIELSDDGSGVDLAAVRRKAIKRGMIHPDADLSDHEVLPFILQAGFSTSEIITQISGRGVGMDVVHAEVKQLGGSMVIDSVPGKGTRFRIRLPISVSVNRALMVTCGEEQYAVPLNTVDGIVRVMANELDGYYQTSPPRYQYGGRSYELRYLGELLGSSPPRLAGHCSRCRYCWCICRISGWRCRSMRWQVHAKLWSRALARSSQGCRAFPVRPFWVMGVWC